MATAIAPYSPGPPRRSDGSLDKRWLMVAGTIVTIATSVVTYTVTVTLLYAEIRSDAALLMQRVEFIEQIHEREHMSTRQRIDAMDAWSKQIQQQLDRSGRP